MFQFIIALISKLRWVTGGILLSLNLLESQALDLQNYIQSHSKEKAENFISQFPYKSYLLENEYGNLKSLSQDIRLLDDQGLPGDKFLYELTRHYIQSNPPDNKDLSTFESRFKLAESFLQDSQPFIFEMIAQVLMEDLALNLDRGLKSGEINKHHPQLQSLVQALSTHRFIVDVPKSDLEKLTYHISQGNWSYILDRVIKEFFWGSPWLLGVFCCGMIFGIYYSRRIFFWAFQLPKLFYSRS